MCKAKDIAPSRPLPCSLPQLQSQSAQAGYRYRIKRLCDYFMWSLALLLPPKCFSDLKYGPCPPERDWVILLSCFIYPIKNQKEKDWAKWAKWARILKNTFTNEQLCSLTWFFLVYACLNMHQNIYLFITFKITVTLCFLGGFWVTVPTQLLGWSISSLPQVTSNTAPALPHASVVAVYPALFHIIGGNWESIRFLRHSSGYPSLIDIFENRSRMFLEQPTMFGNSTLDRMINAFLILSGAIVTF